MTNSTIEIVPFSAEHTAAVIDLIVSIQRGEFAIPITAADQPDLSDIPNFYQHGVGNFWIALHQGKVVGTIALVDIGNQQAALRKMFVHTDFRGGAAGVAKRLLTELLAWSAAHNLREIYLGTTDKFLAAHRFYEKNGFVEVAKADLPPRFPVMGVDSKFYRYAILGGAFAPRFPNR